MFVTERFYLSEEFKQRLREQPVKWGFGLLSVATYYRTYSRRKEDGSNEDWADTVIRCVEGVLSIRKDWYRTVGVKWDHRYWSRLGEEMAEAMFNFRFLPPGRSLWAMGTEYVYERGAMALQNCGAVQVELDAFGKPNLSVAASWAMDALMCGVGVGFGLPRFLHDLKNPNLLRLGLPSDTVTYTYQIPDTREGWAESVRMLIESYELSAQAGNHYPTKLIGPQATIDFDYSLIRQAGATISGFGGVASGPEPLIWLHKQLRSYLNRYVGGSVSQTRLVADIFNAIGACVVAGNVRRSAEIALGSVRDTEFLNLKNYRLYPERAEIGWLSNNSVILQDSSDFAALPNIAERIRDNGEPGVVNLINIQKYGRFKEKKPDRATLMNPCAEQPLESFEVCCLVEVFPTRCADYDELYEAMELATIYASSVSLLRTHSEETNAVVMRNHRIGVSLSGIADWLDTTSASGVTMVLRHGYEDVVVPTNKCLAEEAGVPVSVRVTTVKPSGTISLLAGVSPGMHHPVFRYGVRRMRVSKSSPLGPMLAEAGIPFEEDSYDPLHGTWVFEFPQESGGGKVRSVSEVSLWEQASIVAWLQREWSDNAVSNTLTFSPSREGNQIERVLSTFAPLVKSMSMLPDQSEQQSYAQPPYEKISREEYRERMKQLKEIDWAEFSGGDGQDTKFCDGDVCELPEVSGGSLSVRVQS